MDLETILTTTEQVFRDRWGGNIYWNALERSYLL